MANPADTDRDDALMRRLYDEPDADGADGELAREVESFQRVRSAVAEYARATEVEPPSRGLDELLAAARQRAPARPAAVIPPSGVGLWARLRAWLAPIAAHPALASAAMVVVVAVVGGVLWVKGRSGVTEGEVTRGTQTERKLGPTPPADTDPGMVAQLEDQHAPESAPESAPVQQMTPPPVQPTRPTSGVKQPPSNGTATPAHKPTTKVAGTAPGRVGNGTGKGDTEGPTGGKELSGTDSVAVGQGVVVSDHIETDDAQRPGTEPAVPTSPPPPAANMGGVAGTSSDEVLIAGEDAGPNDGKTKSTQPAKPPGTNLDQLTRQARTAAKSGDCGVVKSIGGRVKKANAAYYKTAFAADAMIKKCL